MSQELFEKYLQDRLSEAEQRELSAILASEKGSREFSEFAREWALLADVSKALASHAAGGTTKIKLRRVGGGSPARGVWWAAGLAAAVLFMVGVFAATRPAAPRQVPSEPVAERQVPTPLPPEPERRPPAPERLVMPRPPEPEAPRVPAPAPRIPEVKPPPVPAPEKPPVPPAPPKGAPEKPTIVALAKVDRVIGPVTLVSPDGRRALKAGQDLLPDQGLETGPRALVSVRYPDETRFDLSADSAIERLSDPKGKLVQLSRGTLSVTAAKQPAGRPMTIRTPHAEATVLGTQLSLIVTADSTRLEVREGKVRLTRADNVSIDVSAGHMAVVAKGVKLESKVLVVTGHFQDGLWPTPAYAGTSDTCVSGAEPLRVFGAADTLEADGDEVEGKKIYALLKWDLSEIPASSVVRSVSITLHVTGTSQGGGYHVYEARRPWVEAEAVWAGFPGVARSPFGTVAPREKGTVAILLTPAGEAVVQSWIRNPSANHGFVIANDSNDDGFRFSARESSAPERRPRLTIEYVPGTK